MELWYTEQHTENVRFSIKVESQIHTEQTEFQRIDTGFAASDWKEILKTALLIFVFGNLKIMDSLWEINE